MITQAAKSNGTYLHELGGLLDHFRDLVETENAAIERRETAVLRGLMPDKVETGNALEALWREFRPRLDDADPRDRERFVALAEQAAQLRPLVSRNMALLNAAKVTTANRIEAGVSAWQRDQRDHQTHYHDDGRVAPSEGTPSITPPRLV